MSRDVGLTADTYGPAERAAVRDVMKSGRYTQGEKVAQFEAAFLRAVDAPEGMRAFMVNSGSSANLLMAELLARDAKRVGKREVITTALTWSTTVAPLILKGLKPVFVDVDSSYAMNPGSVAHAVSDDTLAVLVPHLLGNPAPLNEIMNAVPSGTILMEDCCEAYGATYDGRHVGTFGNASSFSFYFSHHLSTMEGGMLLTSEDVSAWREHGWTRGYAREVREELAGQHPDLDPRWTFNDLGYNLRSMEVNAALGLVQLSRVDGFVKKRRRIRREYDFLLKNPNIVRPTSSAKGVSSPFFYPIRFQASAGSRDELRAWLEASGIETRPVLTGNVTRQPWFKRNMDSSVFRVSSSGLEVTDDIHDHGLLLPLHPLMTLRDVAHVVDSISLYLEKVGLGRIGG